MKVNLSPKKILMSVAMMGAALLSVISSMTPAQATVQNCHMLTGPDTPAWPVQSGNLYNCMPTPRNSDEQALQDTVMNYVRSGAVHYGTSNRPLAGTARVDIRVFYTGQDAFETLHIQVKSGNPAVKPNETGRSWGDPSDQPGLSGHPTSTIWLWTANEYPSVTQPPVRDPVKSQRTMLTLHHELGHIFNVLWAKVQNASWRSLTINDPKWLEAINWDAASTPAAQLSYARTNYPFLFNNDQTKSLNPDETIAELSAITVGGGTNSSEDSWLTQYFTCAYWYIQHIESSAGTDSPSAPSASVCYGHTAW